MTKQLKDFKSDECLEFSDALLLNAQKRWESSILLASIEDYGGAIRDQITSLEEMVKGIIMLMDSKGFEFRKLKGIERILTKNHIQRHYILFWISIIGSINDDLLNLVREFNKNPDLVLSIVYNKEELTFSLKQYLQKKALEIKEDNEWFSIVEKLRQRSVHVDYEGQIISPQSIDLDRYKTIYIKLNTVYEFSKQIVFALNSEDDLYKKPIEGIKQHCINLKIYDKIGNSIDQLKRKGHDPFYKLKNDFDETVLDDFDLEDWDDEEWSDILNSVERMPVPPFIEGNPTKLIVGTFPPHDTKWDFEFFFPNLQNRLWPTLAKFTDIILLEPNGTKEWKINAVEERKSVLRAFNSSMVNIIQACKRNEGKSALDKDLEVVSIQNILDEILKVTPSIKSIFLTSSSGKNSCLSLFKRHLKENNIEFMMSKERAKTREEKINNPLIGCFHFNGNKIKVYSLFSPSPTTKRAGINDDVLERQYRIIAEK